MLQDTQRLMFTAVSLGQLDEIHGLHSLPEVDRFNTLGIPGSTAATRSLIHQWMEMQEAEPPTAYTFCIHHIETKEFIGLIGLKIGKPNYRLAELWYKLHPTHWNKGYATEAVSAILKMCFTGLHLHRIEAGCAVDNTASIKVLEKAGMIREGRKRALLPVRGQWLDNYFYAILENDYNNLTQQHE